MGNHQASRYFYYLNSETSIEKLLFELILHLNMTSRGRGPSFLGIRTKNSDKLSQVITTFFLGQCFLIQTGQLNRQLEQNGLKIINYFSCDKVIIKHPQSQKALRKICLFLFFFQQNKPHQTSKFIFKISTSCFMFKPLLASQAPCSHWLTSHQHEQGENQKGSFSRELVG